MSEKIAVDQDVYLALLGALEGCRRHLQSHGEAGTDVTDEIERLERLLQEARHQLDAEEPPVCAVHHLAMARVRGRTGVFWSCHRKNPDGSWCDTVFFYKEL